MSGGSSFRVPGWPTFPTAASSSEWGEQLRVGLWSGVAGYPRGVIGLVVLGLWVVRVGSRCFWHLPFWDCEWLVFGRLSRLFVLLR